MKQTWVFDSTEQEEVDFASEDGGMARILGLYSRDEDLSLFVRIQSWSEDGMHPEMDAILAGRVRVTVEVEA